MPIPSSILLATDLSARSDRALDRAVRLAREWRAELVIATVVESLPESSRDLIEGPGPRGGGSPVERARRRLLNDLGELPGNVRILVEEGEPAAQIATIAEREGCGLIVTGTARDETLGRMVLGTTVERLVRASPIPVLVVKRRAMRDYRQLLVTTDFSEASAYSLGLAAGLFPDAALALLHGHEIPFALSSREDTFLDYQWRIEQTEVDAFLDRSGLEAGRRAGLELLMEQGDPVHLAQTYIADHDIQLTVVASHGRSALYELAIGSIAKRLVEALDSDILLVRRARDGG